MLWGITQMSSRVQVPVVPSGYVRCDVVALKTTVFFVNIFINKLVFLTIVKSGIFNTCHFQWRSVVLVLQLYIPYIKRVLNICRCAKPNLIPSGVLTILYEHSQELVNAILFFYYMITELHTENDLFNYLLNHLYNAFPFMMYLLHACWFNI